MELNEIEPLLIGIGLTKQEAHCYLALYSLKESKAGKLSKESKIATANIYPVLDSLVKKGLASYRLQNNVKIFFASPPDAFNEFVEQKQKQLNEQREKVKQTISTLKITEIQNEPQSGYKYYEGISGIKSMWYEIFNEFPKLNKSTTIKVYAAEQEASSSLLGFYNEFNEMRIKEGLPYKLILDEKMLAYGKKRSKLYKTEVKYLNSKNKAAWGVIGNMFYINHAIGKKPVCFLIRDEIIAKTFEEAYDRIWETAKKE